MTELCLLQGVKEPKLFDRGIELIDELNAARGSLPLDLTVKYAICHIYAGGTENVDRHLEELLAESVSLYDDLYYEVAEAFLKIADSFYLSGDAKSALKFYGKLEGVPAYDQTALYSKMAECRCGNTKVSSLTPSI